MGLPWSSSIQVVVLMPMLIEPTGSNLPPCVTGPFILQQVVTEAAPEQIDLRKYSFLYFTQAVVCTVSPLRRWLVWY